MRNHVCIEIQILVLKYEIERYRVVLGNIMGVFRKNILHSFLKVKNLFVRFDTEYGDAEERRNMKKLVIILGMRSGTSLTARISRCMGAYLGEDKDRKSTRLNSSHA